MSTIDTMKLALEALKQIDEAMPFPVAKLAQSALREALASEAIEQPAQQQEPVAVVSGYYGGQCVVLPTNPARIFNSGTAFYTSPPASKPWVGLTDEQVIKTFNAICNGKPFEIARILELHKAIEAAHGIKGDA